MLNNHYYPSIHLFEDQNLGKETNATVVEIIPKLDNNLLHGQRFSHTGDFPLETRKKWYKSITNQTSMPSQARSLIPLPFLLRLLFYFIPVKRAIVLLSGHDSPCKKIRGTILSEINKKMSQTKTRTWRKLYGGEDTFSILSAEWSIAQMRNIRWRKGVKLHSNLESWQSIFLDLNSHLVVLE